MSKAKGKENYRRLVLVEQNVITLHQHDEPFIEIKSEDLCGEVQSIYINTDNAHLFISRFQDFLSEIDND